jgi:hypothetical protein
MNAAITMAANTLKAFAVGNYFSALNKPRLRREPDVSIRAAQAQAITVD